MSNRFARLGEEAFIRQAELTGEEWRFYCIIVFHSFIDSGICRKTIRELCDVHQLKYNHTTTRYKILRKQFDRKFSDSEKKRLEKMQSAWCENTSKGIRPLVGMKTPIIGVSIDDNSKNRSPKLQKSESNTPNIGVIDGQKLQNLESPLKEYKEPFKDQISLDGNNSEKPAVVSSSSDSKSQFSAEECLRYVNLRIERGERLETPHKFARWCHQTGEMDAFIMAMLYPPVTPAAPEIEYADGEYEIASALELLRDLQAAGDDLDSMRHWYSPDMWTRLMEELGK